jgi:hypothetical protein
MARPQRKIEIVPIGKLFLLPENPRHEPLQTEEEAIDHLCEHEAVFPLAKDIVEHGTNPLERFALIPIENSSKSSSTKSYHVAEGNRRICAIKLLNDPELAPSKLRTQFTKLASDWEQVKAIEGVIFPTYQEAKIWLKRIHTGEQGGIGRKGWNAEQQARLDGGNKNKEAQKLLDYAENAKLITSDERRKKLTTVQRFLGNETFREAIGIVPSDDDQVKLTRPEADFKVIIKTFISDLVVGKKVTSRMKSDDIKKYARPLSAIEGISGKRVEPAAPTENQAGSRKGMVNKKPGKIDKVKSIGSENEITIALRTLANEKLKSLYFSICDIPFEHHTPLVAIGVWAFFETLTASAGRNEETSFDSYLNKNRIEGYGIKDKARTLVAILQRIGEYGNTTKHHKVAAQFNGQQMHNDMVALKEVILKLIEQSVQEKSKT